MSDFTSSSQALGIVAIFLRLLCAMTVGTVIGTEREYSNRPAGMRTHILVALGSCAVMITSQMLFMQYHEYGALPDPARLPAQVITGVGFLGAGTILREGTNVKGLTTAASLWAVACLGIAAGAGYFAVAAIGTVFIFITLTIFEVLQHRLIGPEGSLRLYWIESENVASALDALSRNAAKQNASIRDISTQRMAENIYRISFHLELGGLHSKRRREAFLQGLSSEPCITRTHVFTNSAYQYAPD